MSYYNQPRNELSSNLKKENLNKLYSVSQGQLCDSKIVPVNPTCSGYVSDQKEFLITTGDAMIKLLDLIATNSSVYKELKDICQWSDDFCIILEKIQRISDDGEVNMLFFKCIKVVELYSIWFAIYHAIHYGSETNYRGQSTSQVQLSSKLFYNLLYSKQWFRDCGFPELPDVPDLTKYYSIQNYFKELNQLQLVNRPFTFLQEVGQKYVDGPPDKKDFGKIQFYLLMRLFGEFYNRSHTVAHLESMWNRWAHSFFLVPFGGFSEKGWITNFSQIFSTYKKENARL